MVVEITDTERCLSEDRPATTAWVCRLQEAQNQYLEHRCRTHNLTDRRVY